MLNQDNLQIQELLDCGKVYGSSTAAGFLRGSLEQVGGFITQHLIWTLQLMGYVAVDSDIVWASARHYCSTRNTLMLFRLLVRPAGPPIAVRRLRGSSEAVGPSTGASRLRVL